MQHELNKTNTNTIMFNLFLYVSKKDTNKFLIEKNLDLHLIKM